MQITTIKIYGFGQFHETTVKLNREFQLIYGPNEAGKSTLVAFIASLLFGFETAKHRYAMYQPKSGALYGGELKFKHHDHDYWLKRVAGPHGGSVTFRDLTADETLDKAALTDLLRPVDKDLFYQIFCFGERELQAVDQLDRFELVQRIQRIGAVGSDNWIGLTKQLARESDALYKPRGRVQPLAKLLREYDALTQEVQTAKQAYQSYQKLMAQQAEGETALAELQQRVVDQQQKLAELQQLVTNYPDFVTYQQLMQQTDSTSHRLSTTDWQTFTKLTAQRNQLQSALDQTEVALADSEAIQPDFEVMAVYQAHQSQIKTLAAQLPQLRELTNTATTQEAQQLASFRQRYGEQIVMARPFSAIDQPRISRLIAAQQANQTKQAAIEQQRRDHQQTFSRLSDQATASRGGISVKWLGAGVVIALLSVLILTGWLKSLGGVAGLLVAAYGIFHPMLQQNGQSAIDAQLTLLSRQLDGDRQQLGDLAGELAELTTQLTEVERHYQLGAYSVDQWLAMQADLQQVSQLQRTIARRQQQRQSGDAELQRYFEQWQFAAPVLQLQGTATQKLMQITNFVAAAEDQVNRSQAQVSERQRLQHVQQDYQQQLTASQKTLQAFLKTANVTTTEAFERQYQASQQAQQRETQLTAVKQRLSESERQRLAQFDSVAAIEAAVETAKAQLQSLMTKRDGQLEQQSEHAYAIEKKGHSVAYQQLLQRRADLEAEIERMTDDWLTNQLLIKWIDQTLVNASQGRQPQILKAVQQFFAVLTDQRYQQVTFTDETVQVTRADGIVFDVGELSSGTAEQLYVALRLAFTQVMADQIQLPMIVDDSFVNFDRQRTARAVKLLTEMGNGQVLYLTANADNLAFVAADQTLNLTNLAVK